jgi:HPt (histidine-containing phosphotransfer) domain-containing protein
LLERSEFDTIRKLAHKLKGAGTSYGFAELTELGAAVERAAQNSSAFSVANQLNELSNYLGRVQLQKR